MSLLSKVKTGLNTTLATLILSTGISAQPIEPAHNWPYNQHTNFSEVKDIDSLETDVINATINLDQLENFHIISAEVHERDDLKDLEILLFDGEDNPYGNYRSFYDGIDRNHITITTPPIIFIPETLNVVLLGYDWNDNVYFLTNTTTTHENNAKTIIVDRNGIEERLYLIEGDDVVRFGRLVNQTLVSTGYWDDEGRLPVGTRHTPLGYWHVRSKYDLSINAGEGWYMYWAMWYFDNTNPMHMRNGIHEGFDGTPWGIPVSHGCTRVPGPSGEANTNEEKLTEEEIFIIEHGFAEYLYEWARDEEEGNETGVLYIDSVHTAWSDKYFFNTQEYYLYKGIIYWLEGNQDCNINFFSILNGEDQNKLNEIIYFSETLDDCFDYWQKPDSSFVETLEKMEWLYTNSQ